MNNIITWDMFTCTKELHSKLVAFNLHHTLDIHSRYSHGGTHKHWRPAPTNVVNCFTCLPTPGLKCPLNEKCIWHSLFSYLVLVHESWLPNRVCTCLPVLWHYCSKDDELTTFLSLDLVANSASINSMHGILPNEHSSSSDTPLFHNTIHTSFGPFWDCACNSN